MCILQDKNAVGIVSHLEWSTFRIIIKSIKLLKMQITE